jgi:hypothetical protein
MVVSMSLRSLSVSALLVALAIAGLACKEEEQTIDIPFDGPDAPIDRKKPNPTPSVSPIPEATTTAEQATHGNGPGAASIHPCCQALRASAKSAKDEAARANLTSAANACDTQRIQLDRGKVTRTQALLAVRLSLLDQAPAACR